MQKSFEMDFIALLTDRPKSGQWALRISAIF